MKRVVPYGIRLGAQGEIETVPIVHARLRSPQGSEISAILIIDSGATISLLSSADADVLGVDLKSGKRVSVRGVTGHEIIGYRHSLPMVVEGFILKRVPIIFSEHPDAPRVLGRAGVFNHFGLLFYQTHPP